MLRHLKVASLALCLAAAAGASPCHASSPWLLLGIDDFMGAIVARPPTEVAGINPATREGYRTFPTYTACKTALRQAIIKYRDTPHLTGGDGQYLCTNLETWQR